MKTFNNFVQDRKVEDCAALMVALGIDSKHFCECFESQVRYAVRNRIPLQEAIFNEAWWNPRDWVRGPSGSSPEGLKARGEQAPKGTWTNTGRRFMGGIRGIGAAAAGLFNGQGAAGQFSTRQSLATLGGAVKDLQNVKANLESDAMFGQPDPNSPQVPLMQQKIPGSDMNFSQAIDAIWQLLNNKLNQMNNATQAGKKRMTPYGQQVSGPGTNPDPHPEYNAPPPSSAGSGGGSGVDVTGRMSSASHPDAAAA